MCYNLGVHKTHLKGLLGELELSLHLIKQGWSVLKPLNQNSRYDIVLEKKGKFKRVQIKYCTPQNGRLRLELDKPKRKTKPYSSDEIDYIGVYNSRDQKFYLIPIKEFGDQKEMWLRVDNPKNNQNKHIRFAKKFEI